MNKKTLITLIIVLCVILAAELVFVGVMHFTGGDNDASLQTDPITTQAPTTVPATTQVPTEEATTAPVETTVPPTGETTAPTESEPTEQRYVLTFTGDCTLGSDPSDFASQYSFIGTIGEDYDFPFRNVVQYFENDDFTLINLESVLADSNKGEDGTKRFTFRGPTAYTRILTGSSVEGVTLANNHTEDFGKEGYASTVDALNSAGVAYVEEDKTKLVTTESGLVIGLYADSFYFSKSEIQKNVASLRNQGAEIIICAFHWGTEGSYRPTAEQQNLAKAAIDAGADIVWGSHPHVLQKIEEYGDGVIFYSLGNFSFGGNNFPRDLDSAILQQEIIRDVDGTVRLGELTIIPVSITSLDVQNNFQPTPCDKDSERYKRVLSKLDGTFNGPDLVVDYSFMDDPTEPPTQAPTEVPGGDTPPATEPPAPEDPPADGGDTGGETPPPADGGDTGGETPPPADGGDTGGETPPPADNGGGEG